MSDTNLHGVLRMPPELWRDDPLDIVQRHGCYIQASDRIKQIEAELAAIKAGNPDFSTPLVYPPGYLAAIAQRDATIAELQKQLASYEQNGVTCQTYRHKIDGCSDCNRHDCAELRQRLEWQPIETAPDERSIDIWLVSMDNPEFGVRITCVHRVGSRWFGIPDYYKEDRFKPTHWMPLPNLPALADGERYAGVRRSPI